MRTRACYLAIGVTCDGEREVLGIWWQETEGAKFWLAVLNDLHHRGVARRPDRLRRRPDRVPRGDRGRLPPSLGADLHRPPDPSILRYVNYRDRKRVAARPRPIYTRRQRRRRRSQSSSASTSSGASATR